MSTVVTADQESLSAYGPARSTVQGAPLSAGELQRTGAYWRACNYLALGMIYLQDNPLLKEPLKPEHIKNRLLGHWGSSPGLAFIYTHLNRVIKKYDQSMIFLAGPGFLDVVVNKSAAVTRIYLPPDVNSLLSVADHCLRSLNYVNVIVSDKQMHLQYMDLESAIEHCTKGIGIWAWASNDQGGEPDLVMASAGDIPTQEALAAIVLLRQEFPDVKIRFVNVVDLFKLQPSTEHPHGLNDRDFDSLFTVDKPIIFNFHGYPWLIHRLAYRRTNHHNLHVRGYKERGNINTPMELAINNEIDRFSLAIDAIDRTPKLQRIGAHAKEKFRNLQIACRHHAYQSGIDSPEITGWRWPY